MSGEGGLRHRAAGLAQPVAREQPHHGRRAAETAPFNSTGSSSSRSGRLQTSRASDGICRGPLESRALHPRRVALLRKKGQRRSRVCSAKMRTRSREIVASGTPNLSASARWVPRCGPGNGSPATHPSVSATRAAVRCETRTGIRTRTRSSRRAVAQAPSARLSSSSRQVPEPGGDRRRLPPAPELPGWPP